MVLVSAFEEERSGKKTQICPTRLLKISHSCASRLLELFQSSNWWSLLSSSLCFGKLSDFLNGQWVRTWTVDPKCPLAGCQLRLERKLPNLFSWVSIWDGWKRSREQEPALDWCWQGPGRVSGSARRGAVAVGFGSGLRLSIPHSPLI